MNRKSGARPNISTRNPVTQCRGDHEKALEIEVEDYGGKEKIYYPPKKLNTSTTPLVKSVHPSTLACYAPWDDVVMFYAGFGSASGLYELGEALKGAESIRSLSGTLRIEAR